MKSIRPLSIRLPNGVILIPCSRQTFKKAEPTSLGKMPFPSENQKLPKLNIDWNKTSVR